MSANTTGIKFLYSFTAGDYDYLNPGGNVVSVTSTAPGDHDKLNLTTPALRETWRSTGVADFQEIVIATTDRTISPDCFAVLNHNLTSLAVVTVTGSQTLDFTGGVEVAMLWTKKHMVLLQDYGVAYRYWRFKILDPTNGCGFIELGGIRIGKTLTFINNEDITDDISVTPSDKAYKTQTEGFFRAFNQRVIVNQVQVNFSQLITTSNGGDNYTALSTMFDAVGETFPFLTIVDPADQRFFMTWGVIDTLPSLTFGINRYLTAQLTIQEQY
jgi:hypothetical protein